MRRQAGSQRRQTLLWLAAAAVVLIAVGGGGYGCEVGHRGKLRWSQFSIYVAELPCAEKTRQTLVSPHYRLLVA
jgi:hypothetical protein